MADARFELHKFTGSGAGTDNTTNKVFAFLNVDEHQEDPGYSTIPQPTLSGQHTYSFEQYLKFIAVTMPDNYVTDFIVWGSVSHPDSPNNKATVMFGTTVSGATPVNTASSVATVDQHANYNDSSNGLAIQTTDIVPSGNDETDFWVAQLKLDFGIESGTLTPMIFHYSYIEG